MSEQITVAKSIEIGAPASELWHKTAEDFGGIDKWIAAVSDVTLLPTDSGASLGTERVCRSPFGDTREVIVTYDEEERVFGYGIQGLPPFVTNAVNTWSIVEKDEHTSELTMTFTADSVSGADPEMVTGLQSQLGKLLGEATEELKHFIETGKPHPRKLQAAATSS